MSLTTDFLPVDQEKRGAARGYARALRRAGGQVAQAIPQFGADPAVGAEKATMVESAIAEKGHLRM